LVVVVPVGLGCAAALSGGAFMLRRPRKE
jgi:hypothetical protein